LVGALCFVFGVLREDRQFAYFFVCVFVCLIVCLFVFVFSFVSLFACVFVSGFASLCVVTGSRVHLCWVLCFRHGHGLSLALALTPHLTLFLSVSLFVAWPVCWSTGRLLVCL
jgi:hypothetical protein